MRRPTTWPHHGIAILATVALVLAACGQGQSDTTTFEATDPASPPAEATATGDRVPDRPVEAFDGATVSLTDYAGTPLVVNFWASWCPPCVAEMPDLEAVHQATAGEVAFVGVNTQDTPEAAARLVEETGVTYDLVRDPDGELFRAFGGFGMPSTFYVDADGTIVDRHTGLLTRDAMMADLEENFGIAVEAGP